MDSGSNSFPCWRGNAIDSSYSKSIKLGSALSDSPLQAIAAGEPNRVSDKAVRELVS